MLSCKLYPSVILGSQNSTNNLLGYPVFGFIKNIQKFKHAHKPGTTVTFYLSKVNVHLLEVNLAYKKFAFVGK